MCSPQTDPLSACRTTISQHEMDFQDSGPVKSSSAAGTAWTARPAAVCFMLGVPESRRVLKSRTKLYLDRHDNQNTADGGIISFRSLTQSSVLTPHAFTYFHGDVHIHTHTHDEQF